MLRMAWFLVAVPWAMLILWLSSFDDGFPELHVWIIALGPLALPWLLRRMISFVLTGSVNPQRPLPYRHRAPRPPFGR
jgi:hypothetical protein